MPGVRVQSCGFGILEILVAVVLVGILASSLGSVTLASLGATGVSAEVTGQTTAAVHQMEVLLALAFEDPGLGAGGSLLASNVGYSEDPLDGDANRYVRWEIIDETAILKRINLVAGIRNSLQGPGRVVRLETLRVASE